jgi:peptidyl-prolyl cis-trans isomerase D
MLHIRVKSRGAEANHYPAARSAKPWLAPRQHQRTRSTMLDAMRRGALNWFAKALLGLLVIAFAVWGIGDGIRRIGRGTVAKIGSTEITAEEFRQAYQDELASFARRAGRRLTPEQAKLLRIDQRALSRLVGTAAINMHARDLGLRLSEQGIADIIREDPAFHDANGAFSNRLLQAYAHRIGMSPERYVEVRRQEEVRDQLIDTLLAGAGPPQTLVDILHRYTAETRVIEYISPDFDKLIKVAAPDDSKLREYYEQNKGQFLTPELRKVNVLLLTREEARARVPVSDEEIRSAYDADQDKYNIAEKRHILQLPFPDKAAAEKTYAELAKAKNFKEAAAKLGFKESDIDLGVLTRRDMIDPKIADAAFALKKDELSKPVEGQFAIVLLRVTEIVAGKQRTFDEVKAEIRDRIADERVGQEIQALHEKVENERSAAKSFKEIAGSLKLPYREIAEIDRAGRTAGGTPAIEHNEAAKVAEAAFAGAVGVEAEATDLADGGYVWVEVLAVTPEKQKTFEAVQADVKAAAIAEEKGKETAALATKLVERLNKGEPLDGIAKETGAKVEKTNPLMRITPAPAGLTQGAIQQAFALPKGGASSTLAADRKGRTLIRVAEVNPAPPATPEQVERLKSELSRQLQTDVLAEYVAGLQARYGLTVNEAVLRQAVGADRDQPDVE